jgi:XTP/dITP diphosphohydrolase
MKLYCATTNPGKIREFQASLAGHFDVAVIPGLAGIAPPEETGDTFEANAMVKARYYSRFCNGLLFADDSGLAVDALGGAPGVMSARFAGPNATDEENNRLLLERLQGVRHRKARFVCAIALARGGDPVGTFSAEVEGEITDEPRGQRGFGYDPLFYYEPFECTFGQALLADKKRVSHRARALAQMREWLKQQKVVR